MIFVINERRILTKQALVKEWHDRQSPTVMWGNNIWVSLVEGWDRTGGKCEYTTFFRASAGAFNLGYAITNKTLPTRNAYIERWGEDPTAKVVDTYDAMYILYSALERAGTTETDEVIQALEKTSIETCTFPHFAFSSSHDSLIIEEDINSRIVPFFQYQTEGKIVPVYPKEMMEEAEVTYIYPNWSIPWDARATIKSARKLSLDKASNLSLLSSYYRFKIKEFQDLGICGCPNEGLDDSQICLFYLRVIFKEFFISLHTYTSFFEDEPSVT